MKITNEMKKTIKTYTDNFNKNGIIKLDSSKILEIIKNLPECDSEQNAKQICNLYMANIMNYIANLMEAHMAESKGMDFSNIPAKADIFTRNSLEKLLGNREVSERVWETHELRDLDIKTGEIFTRFANAVLGQKNYRLSDTAIMGVKDAIKDGEPEELAIVKITSTLKTQITPYKALYLKKDKNTDITPSNKDFNQFLKEISVSYNAVHDLYNEKGFFGKWFTSSGWALRSAMNEAKDTVKAYYKSLAAQNAKDGITQESEVLGGNIPADGILPSEGSNAMDKLSSILHGFGESSRVQVSLDYLGQTKMDVSPLNLNSDLDLGLVSDKTDVNHFVVEEDDDSEVDYEDIKKFDDDVLNQSEDSELSRD